MNFEGTYVAMVTPFTKEGTLDEEGFRSNINYLIDKGVNGLVGAGTTGESATMTHEEHHKVIEVLVMKLMEELKQLQELEVTLLPKQFHLLNLHVMQVLTLHC